MSDFTSENTLSSIGSYRIISFEDPLLNIDSITGFEDVIVPDIYYPKIKLYHFFDNWKDKRTIFDIEDGKKVDLFLNKYDGYESTSDGDFLKAWNEKRIFKNEN